MEEYFQASQAEAKWKVLIGYFVLLDERLRLLVFFDIHYSRLETSKSSSPQMEREFTEHCQISHFVLVKSLRV